MQTLKIRSLPKTRCDRDEVLLHAVFQVLVDFVEKETPDKIIDWNADDEHRKVWSEIKSLYRWWKKTRPSRVEPIFEKGIKSPPMKFGPTDDPEVVKLLDYDKRKYAKWYGACRRQRRLEEKWHHEDQRNLHRLVDVRPWMWV